jgi:hypothetical protein
LRRPWLRESAAIYRWVKVKWEWKILCENVWNFWMALGNRAMIQTTARNGP